jgi:PAS domain S-box-containing protein
MMVPVRRARNNWIFPPHPVTFFPAVPYTLLILSVNIRNKFVFILGLALVINLASGFYALYSYRSAASRSAEIRDHSFQVVNASLSAQVHFKKQVQEWKNILLRGHESTLYDKYLEQFIDEERQTKEQMQILLSLLTEGTEAKKTALAFLDAHQRLGARYREALRLFQPRNPSPHVTVDLQVRGIDREPTDLLDQVVSEVQQQKLRQLKEIGAQVDQAESRVFVIICATAVLLILLVYSLTDRMIARRILAATAVANRISRGDLSGEIEAEGGDEAAQLLQALQTMQLNVAKSQQVLQESEERNRLLLESTGEGIYGVDREGRCIFINPAGAYSLGYTHPAELVGEIMHEVIHHTRPDGSPLTIEQCQASQTYISGKSAIADDELFWRADGSSFPVEYRSHPIYQHNTLIGAVVTFADITQRKASEEALQSAHDQLREERALLAQRVEERTAELNLANAELEKNAKAKDAFLASMSHELRTPLTTIMGLTEFLSDKLYGPLNSDQEKALGTILESSRHLLALINDVLDVAKVEAGKMELNWDEVPVQQLAESSLRMIHQQAQKKGLQVSCQTDPDIQFVFGDPRRLKQMLINLLSNAVKFTPEGGSVGLEIAADRPKGEIRLRVRDNGIGIPTEEQERLFRPFVQVDNSITRLDGGTGLGLALVYRMAQLHGGRVEVDSTPGKGSVFTIYLPWKKPDMEAGPTQKPRPSESADFHFSKDATVLVAEDNATIQALLRDYLEKHGLRVLLAADGKSVLALAEEHHPDLVLMDVQLPVMDGLETVHRMRQDPELNKITVIALTALAMPGDRERCLEAGMDDYISKPVGMRELLQLIASHLSRAQKHG